ncbi:MAG TPA: amidohydrolase family protein [Flexilinea sp.]|nr:amidohydrolase family protein [Flexilinea sp.]
MPEAAAWKYQKILKPIIDIHSGHYILKGRILTCVHDEVIENGFVEINGKTIADVGKWDPATEYADAEIIEVENGTIMPALFNNHAHLAWDGIHDLADQSLNDTPEISAYKSCANMLLSLRAGITTVRDLGVNKANIATKQAVEQGIFPGPRLLITGEAIVQTGGHTYWACREATGADEMRRAVRDQVRNGADLIKIMACHDRLEFTDSELEAIIDEAHRNGLPVTAHATFNAAVKRMAQFGVDVIEHGGDMDDETIGLLLEKKIPIVTTFSAVVIQSRPEIARKYNIPEWKIEERQRQAADKAKYNDLVKASKAGVMIAFGTDAGSPCVQHNMIVPEMEFMVHLGLVDGNYGALQSATSISAKLNKLDQKLGTLEKGKLADVIVMEGNPLEDLSALTKVKYTFKEGCSML